MKKIAALALITILLLAGCGGDSSQNGETPAASQYIQNKGSDTIVNLALAWAERYQTVRPEVRISVTGGGSGTGIVSLFNRTVDIANASRQIKEEELASARAAGIDAVEHVIARDAIAVIIHPDNPVQQLSIDQLSRIFKGEINNWSELGGEDRPIVKLSRESNSGTHVYFLETVVRQNDPDDKSLFAPSTLLLPSSEGIISEVRDNPNAIGYDGLGYVTEDVKVVGITRPDGQGFVMPSIETVNNGEYPISRDLYMYTRSDPGLTVEQYLEWILSDEAQQIVTDLGFVPVKE